MEVVPGGLQDLSVEMLEWEGLCSLDCSDDIACQLESMEPAQCVLNSQRL